MNVYTGKITKAASYPYDTPKTFVWDGKEIINTHRLALQLEDGSYVGFGDTDKESFIVKDSQGNWKILGAGSTVNFVYTTTEGKNGKTYKNAKKGNLTVIDLVEGERFGDKPSNTSSPAGGDGKKDTVAITLGNALSCANNMSAGSDVVALVDLAKLIYPVGKGFVEAMTQAHPSMDSYSVGARAGQCMLMASTRTTNINELVGIASSLFALMCKAEEDIRTPAMSPPEAQQPAGQPTQQNSQWDFDDGIPF